LVGTIATFKTLSTSLSPTLVSTGHVQPSIYVHCTIMDGLTDASIWRVGSLCMADMPCDGRQFHPRLVPYCCEQLKLYTEARVYASMQEPNSNAKTPRSCAASARSCAYVRRRRTPCSSP
jgi:hypothetical protein